MPSDREIRLNVSAADAATLAKFRAFLRDHPRIRVVGGDLGHAEMPADPLTDAEVALLTSAADGKPLEQVADERALAYGTVKNYLSRIYAKLGVRNLAAALQQAEEHGYEIRPYGLSHGPNRASRDKHQDRGRDCA